MKRRGDLSLSFGMIFSIIIIIAIIGIAFYTITYFINLGKCTEVAFFYQDFQEKVDKAWNSQITSDTFIANLPSGIESICLGNLKSPGLGANSKEFQELKIYDFYNANLFIYPPEESCDLPYMNLEHVDLSSINGFTCIPLLNGEFKINLEKTTQDSLVRLKLS